MLITTVQMNMGHRQGKALKSNTREEITPLKLTKRPKKKMKIKANLEAGADSCAPSRET
jgi:hypothetical protein